jgi:hypothetical protein
MPAGAALSSVAPKFLSVFSLSIAQSNSRIEVKRRIGEQFSPRLSPRPHRRGRIEAVVSKIECEPKTEEPS